jgi:hypothetical protein
MPAPPTIKSELLKPLAALSAVQQGAVAYYRELRHSADPILMVGAWCGLLDAKAVPQPMWDEVIPLCRYGAIRSRAFFYFREAYEGVYARKAAMVEVPDREEIVQRVMLSRLDFDAMRTAAIEGELYLATGDSSHLYNASGEAEIAGGWRPSLEWAVRAVAVAPLNPKTIQRMFTVLESSVQPDLLEEAAAIFSSRNMYLQISQIFLAAAAAARKDPALCLTRLQPLDDAKVAANAALKPYLGAIRALRADAEDKLGHYPKAYEAYVALNAADRLADNAVNIDPKEFYRGVEVRSKVNVLPLPADEHREVLQMLGFPRSGTTLLENALAAHPLVETFEEVPSFNIAIDRIERAVLGKTAPELPETTFLQARARYYADIESRRRKPAATALVDKLPLRSADAVFASRLFPEWRYIFSIRNPYDVVLSCFKQRFGPNQAMENLRTIELAARMYDFTMTEWFKVHTMDDAKVSYVRYDELVNDFETVMHRTLEFVGVPWDDSVRDFSKSAEQRAVKTPSYHKVRQGLGIGVQTAWRNYDFVFKSPAAAPLHKWVEFFGYPRA